MMVSYYLMFVDTLVMKEVSQISMDLEWSLRQVELLRELYLGDHWLTHVLRWSMLTEMMEGKRIAGQGKYCCLDDKKQCKTSLVGLCAMAVLCLPTEKYIEYF